MQINKIVIVGGGSSGWMTASALCKNVKGLDITLIENKEVETIGVGESTLSNINYYFDLIDIEDEDWMKKCNATYKTSIKFTNFKQLGSSFFYPFGDHLGNNFNYDIDTWFYMSSMYPNQYGSDDFSHFINPITFLSEHNRMSSNKDNKIPNFNFKYDTAYHLDSNLLGYFLKDKICIPNGVNHIIDEIVEIKKENCNKIKYIQTKNGLKIEADLFIDCTGFSSVLLEKTMNSKFISFEKTLLNDKAFAAKIPYDEENVEKEMQNYTNCTAIENGWCWNIPLWDRIGSGYVYSSKFVDDNIAEKQYRKYLKKTFGDKCKDIEFKKINIRHGKREKCWVGNVYGIGLSYGFLEPLESTGLLTIHENIKQLISILNRDRYINQFDINSTNLVIDKIIEGLKAFIELHYVLSKRDDTEYWRYATNNSNYKITNAFNNFSSCHYYQKSYLQLEGGLPYIVAGFDYNPISKTHIKSLSYEEIMYLKELKLWWDIKKNEFSNYIQSLPSHYNFLKGRIYE